MNRYAKTLDLLPTVRKGDDPPEGCGLVEEVRLWPLA